MRALGVAFQKGRMRITALDLNGGHPSYYAGRAISVDPTLSLPELMERYATQMRLLIKEFAPDVVAARLVWNSKNVDAAMCQVAPIGIAAYVCQERAIAFKPYTPQALRQPKPFGLAQGINPFDIIDAQFGKHPPNWDEMQKNSLLPAWRALVETT